MLIRCDRLAGGRFFAHMFSHKATFLIQRCCIGIAASLGSLVTTPISQHENKKVRNVRVRISIVGKMISLPFYEIVVFFGGSEATSRFLGSTSNGSVIDMAFLPILCSWTTAWYRG